ncbi:MAG: hypothetical protein D6681_05130, partial [Calditrichaeota bacterium]
MKRWNGLLLMLLFALGGLLLTCDKNPADSERSRGTTLRLQLGEVERGRSHFWFTRSPKGGQVNPGAPGEGEPVALSKIGAIDEVNLLVLDMSHWENPEEFLNAWDGTNQTAFLDSSVLQGERDFWENVVLYLRSYSGDFFNYVGDFELEVENGVARGVVRVDPGWHFFLIALRERHVTRFSDGKFFFVRPLEENHLCFGCDGLPLAPVVQISSPEDSSVSTLRVIPVRGTVSDDTISTATLTINGQSQTIPVDGGIFNNPVVLSADTNIIRVEAANEFGVGSDEVMVIFQGQAAVMRANLTWDTDGTDMDLHMINPAGVECFFAARNVGGMELDVDDIDGFGPENISVIEPVPGNYIVRVVNFTGPGGFGTTATVRIFKNGQLIDTQRHT